MKEISRKHLSFRKTCSVCLGIALLSTAATIPSAQAQESAARKPALVITSDPLPESLRNKIYNKPVQTRVIEAEDVKQAVMTAPQQTLVTRKVNELNTELANLQNGVGSLLTRLNDLQVSNQEKAAEYYAAVATVNTQLQSGTTPGNPRLVEKLEKAETNLDNLTSSVSKLNQLAMDTSHVSSEASFLQEEVRAAYNLSGAVEEDHISLAQTEDGIHNTIIILERILNNVSDDITRTSTYLSSERSNLRALSLAVKNGDLYGKSLANRPFSGAPQFIPASANANDMPGNMQGAPMQAPTALSGPRPLVKIRFDRPDVEYEQPVYLAVNEALERYPNARFDLVAVHPTEGNAAQVAIESTRARRNAERVLRALTEMGLPLDRIDLSYSEDPEAKSNEVHIYIR